MIQIIPNLNLEAKDIKLLRSICKKSISEIRESSASRTPIREIEIFKTEWEEEKVELVKIYKLFVSEPNPPFSIKEVNEFGLDETVTPEMFRNRIEHWRGIELETEMHTELELGEISHPDQFKPSSEEWT
jgi:hypothetical protein